MVLNTAETKVLLITTSQKRSRCQESLSLKYNNITLEVTTGDKVLGLSIHSTPLGLLQYNMGKFKGSVFK